MRPVRPWSRAGALSEISLCGLGPNTLAANSPSVEALEKAFEGKVLNTRAAADSGVSAAPSCTSRVGRSSGDGSSMTVVQLASGAWCALRLLFTSTVNGRVCGFICDLHERGRGAESTVRLTFS